jgi:peptide deformylase
MLKIHLLNTRGGGILREDLSALNTDARSLKPYHADLVRLCKENNGVGVAANQVGLRENFFFLAAGAKVPTNSAGKYVAHICANPTWQPAPGATLVAGQEGCMSLPGRLFTVGRWSAIDAEWDNVLGHIVKKRLKGWPARVFQHEHDHLRGVTLLESGEEVSDEL